MLMVLMTSFHSARKLGTLDACSMDDHYRYKYFFLYKLIRTTVPGFPFFGPVMKTVSHTITDKHKLDGWTDERLLTGWYFNVRTCIQTSIYL